MHERLKRRRRGRREADGVREKERQNKCHKCKCISHRKVTRRCCRHRQEHRGVGRVPSVVILVSDCPIGQGSSQSSLNYKSSYTSWLTWFGQGHHPGKLPPGGSQWTKKTTMKKGKENHFSGNLNLKTKSIPTWLDLCRAEGKAVSDSDQTPRKQWAESWCTPRRTLWPPLWSNGWNAYYTQLKSKYCCNMNQYQQVIWITAPFRCSLITFWTW